MIQFWPMCLYVLADWNTLAHVLPAFDALWHLLAQEVTRVEPRDPTLCPVFFGKITNV